MRITAIMLAPALLGACAASAPGEVPERPTGGTCNANAASRFVGQTATSDTGQAILVATGARSLRWGPPGGAMTMDFREDRVNVFYDASTRIERITCG